MIQRGKLLLDRPRASEPPHGVDAAGLVVGAAAASAAEGLLPDQSGSSLGVYRSLVSHLNCQIGGTGVVGITY